MAIVAGIILVLGGAWGICFTYKNVAKEKIVTPKDAAISSAEVRGPFTLKAQADIIETHTLKMTNGLRYSEMPRQIAKLDESGNPVLDEAGKPVMIANSARDTWITATALTTALNLGIVTYAFSGIVLLLGFISIWTGFVFRSLSKNLK